MVDGHRHRPLAGVARVEAPTRARRCTTAARATRTASIASACAACWSSARLPASLALLVVAGLFVRSLSSAQRHRSRLRRRTPRDRAARSAADRLRRGLGRTSSTRSCCGACRAWPDVDARRDRLHAADELSHRRRLVLHRRAAARRRRPAAGDVHQSRRPRLLRHDGDSDRRGRAFTEDDEREQARTRRYRDRQRDDGGEVLAGPGSDRQALPRLQPGPIRCSRSSASPATANTCSCSNRRGRSSICRSSATMSFGRLFVARPRAIRLR